MTISRRAQLAMVLGLFGFLTWVAYASVNVVFKEQILVEREKTFRENERRYYAQLAEMQTDYDNLQAALTIAQEQFAAELADLRKRQRQLEAVVGRNDEVREARAEIEERLAGATFNPPPADGDTGNEVLMQALDRDSALRRSLPNAEPPSTQMDGLHEVFLGMAPGERNGTALKEGASDALKLETQVTEMRREQRLRAFRMEEEAAREIARLEAVIDMAGLERDALIERYAPPREAVGQGGPLIALPGGVPALDSAAPDTAYERQLVRVARKLDRLTDLKAVIKNLPVAMPTEYKRMTSGFGPRRDPFTGRAAWHSGLDFGGPRGLPIFSVAEGTVTLAGWRGAYGRMVEIDHGNGFKTRYAHLHRIKVKPGQRVSLGDVIGQMGNTGRSTATHLHYEVWFDGKATDPLNYLKAGRYVLEK